jgi:prepilin-type N-terminal cleavage/methylation domain-containing protein
MRVAGYSLVEVIVAAAIIAVGLTATAVLVGTLITQEEVNAAVLRGANLQEQAIQLYRLGIADPLPLLPESEGYEVSFAAPLNTNFVAGDGTIVAVQVSACTLVCPDPSGGGLSLSNTVNVVRPSIRTGY